MAFLEMFQNDSPSEEKRIHQAISLFKMGSSGLPD
jgi:hypothetical protein